MYCSSMIKKVLISSQAALPTSLLMIGYEGSIIRFAGWFGTACLIYSMAIIGSFVIACLSIL